MNIFNRKKGMLERKRHIHFVGIGGVGMSAIAQILFRRGYAVSGSDLKANSLTDRMAALGITIFTGHARSNISGADLIVYSSCIPRQNPEIMAARRRGIPLVARGTMLAEIARPCASIAISGAHGKTTTTGMTASICMHAGLDPTVLVGGVTSFLQDANAHSGSGSLLITETDESDGSFLELSPTYPVITNIDLEHMDYYHDINEIIAAYRRFAQNRRPEGALIVNSLNEYTGRLLQGLDGPSVSFGLSSEADFYPRNLTLMEFGSRFDCVAHGTELGTIELAVPGIHNVENALAATAATMQAGVGFAAVRKGLRLFDGTKRRFEVRYAPDDIMIVEDYAHHPTAIRAIIQAAKRLQRRIICVFQPHRYSRTKCLQELFVSCFQGVDYLAVTDIYAASEAPLEDVSGWSFYKALEKGGYDRLYFFSQERILDFLECVVRPHDVVLILGAGDIGEIARKFSARLAVS
ncbi:MAG: UDP-N-acetylmuramate--L-alanine ligase [Candidatus Omnitrophica bacterium]|nr:UDP-N-acetylmuramate--L-alanine ligase [Candidatus Omnitrophota bacterium]